tara:strand:+ start:586 stop:2505 length:1920 start_codon:yes stop_codon:yes gene_type:complete
MSVCSLLSSTVFKPAAFNGEVLDALSGQKRAQRATVLEALDAAEGPVPLNYTEMKNRWADFRERQKTALSFDDVQKTMWALDENGQTPNLQSISSKKYESPLSQLEFYEAVQKGVTDAEKLKQQLQKLRDEAKQERGYLQKAFSIFSKEKPLDEVLGDVADFEMYCRRNHIKFDTVDKQLKKGARHNTACEKIKEFRFLAAATGGLALGAAGVNAATALPFLAAVPGLFFGALPYVAVPFICLNIYKAFSQKSIVEEAGTFGRFAGTMTAGFLISLGVTTMMSGMLNPVDIAGVDALAPSASEAAAAGEKSFSPAQYILHGIVGSAAFASIYRSAKSGKDKLMNGDGKLSKLFNGAHDLVINRYTRPAINATGNVANKAANGMDKFFGHYMNYLGIPAIFTMMSSTFAAGGIGQLAGYAGYYLTVFTGFGAAAVALGAASYLYGCRKQQLKSMFKTVATAFSISSSAATMPVTKESLKEIGVSEKTRNSVVPLGANFNMMGTALYLGTTAACASVMFGIPLGVMGTVAVLGTVLATAFGAPGAPSSNLILLDPVLNKLGMMPAQIQKMYSIVLPVDRIFDMCQTSLNVWGDMIVAIGKDKREKKKQAAIASGATHHKIIEKRAQSILKTSSKALKSRAI